MGISSLIYDSWKRDSQFEKYEGMLSMLQAVNLHGKTLDVGIGTALFEEFLKGKGINLDVVGIDPDATMLQDARKRGYNVVLGTAEKLPFETESFDFIVCLDVIHASKDQAKAIEEMKRVLKPEGYILISRFCNTFNSSKTMTELEELVAGWQVLDKKIVGRSDDELGAVLLCRK